MKIINFQWVVQIHTIKVFEFTVLIIDVSFEGNLHFRKGRNEVTKDKKSNYWFFISIRFAYINTWQQFSYLICHLHTYSSLNGRQLKSIHNYNKFDKLQLQISHYSILDRFVVSVIQNIWNMWIHSLLS